jgi:UDPglucose 6-dehydrogenase
MEKAADMLPGVTLCSDAYEAASDADAVVLLTEWNEFKQLDLGRLRAVMAKPIFVDGRNLYEPEAMAAAGFTYLSIGRGPNGNGHGAPATAEVLGTPAAAPA